MAEGGAEAEAKAEGTQLFLVPCCLKPSFFVSAFGNELLRFESTALTGGAVVVEGGGCGSVGLKLLEALCCEVCDSCAQSVLVSLPCGALPFCFEE